MNFSTAKSRTEKFRSPFMMFNASYIIAKNHYKSGKTLLSRSLIPLNEVFDKKNKLGTPILIKYSK